MTAPSYNCTLHLLRFHYSHTQPLVRW